MLRGPRQESQTAIALPVDERSGYCCCSEDFSFLGISKESIGAYLHRLAPLGMTTGQYALFVDSLRDALFRDGVNEVDVRLKGSSVDFFSGYHKLLPWTRLETVETYRYLHRRLPYALQVDHILATMEAIWPSAQPRPSRRPFDSLFVLGLSPERSDYDLQLSSDIITNRAIKLIEELGLEANELTVHSTQYAFIRKDLVEEVCPYLHLWTVRQREALGRLVSVAVFPARGPLNREEEIGPQSAHFRPTDWVVDI